MGMAAESIGHGLDTARLGYWQPEMQFEFSFALPVFVHYFTVIADHTSLDFHPRLLPNG
jgi:hypothetical protein